MVSIYEEYLALVYVQNGNWDLSPRRIDLTLDVSDGDIDLERRSMPVPAMIARRWPWSLH